MDVSEEVSVKKKLRATDQIHVAPGLHLFADGRLAFLLAELPPQLVRVVDEIGVVVFQRVQLRRRRPFQHRFQQVVRHAARVLQR